MASHLGVDPTHSVHPLSPAMTRKVITSLNDTHESPLYLPRNWRHSYLGVALEQLEKFVLVHVRLINVIFVISAISIHTFFSPGARKNKTQEWP